MPIATMPIASQDASLPHARDAALFALASELRDAGYRFVTVTPASHARVNARPGNAQARTLADVFGWSRPFAPGLLTPTMLEALRRADAVEDRAGLLASRIRVSSLGGELFIHSAFPTSNASAVFFGPDTYRFATAIEQWLGTTPRAPQRAVDIGCGAGPGGIVVAKALPRCTVHLVDINDQALRLAGINAALAGASNATACRSDLLSALDGRFDLIVANPPYLLDPSRRAYRHGGGALGEGLSLSILEAALERLSPGGTLLLYTGVAVVDGEDVFERAFASRLARRDDVAWHYREMDPDVFGEELDTEAYGGTDRIAAVVLTLTKNN